MRTSILVIFVGALALAASAQERTSATLVKCPYGHQTLRDVPLRYGFYPGPWSAAFNKALARREFALGGCTQSETSPRFEVVCTRCGFTHSMIDTDMPESASWSRVSKDPASFKQPLSLTVTSFPKPTAKQRSGAVRYTQVLTSALAVEMEAVNYGSREPVGKLCDRIARWARGTGRSFTYQQRAGLRSDGRPLKFFDWTAGYVTVNVITGYDHGLTAVALYVHHAPVPQNEPVSDGELPGQPKIPGLVP